MGFEEFLTVKPFSLARSAKRELLLRRMNELTELHRGRCPEYAAMLGALGYSGAECPERVPFLPVRLFKEMSLRSVPEESVAKTVTSSGTTGQAVSRIYLDRATAANQQKALARTVADFIGGERLPMLVIDSPEVLRDRNMFSARGAGILGFSVFARSRVFALRPDMTLDIPALKGFLEEHGSGRFLMFGFTFMVWQHFYKELERLAGAGERFDLSNGVLIHGGGWKKLASLAVSRLEFKDRLREVCGLERAHDYYGMAEQTGAVSMECEYGHLHCGVFSDVIIRRPGDFGVCRVGEPGLIQVMSVIPESYPGHSLLTEDEGTLLGEDDCPCGRRGKYFSVSGRLRDAEIRGCGDTYAERARRG